MKKIDGRKLRDAIIVAVCSVIICVSVGLYSAFTTNQIFDESAEHLSEIYDQVNLNFQQNVTNYRKTMRSWKKYVINITKDASRHGEFRDFIAEQKSSWGFTDFYLVGEIDKETGTAKGKRSNGVVENLDFRREIDVLLGGDDVGVVGWRTDANGNSSRFVMFAVPFAETDGESYEFDGFSYSAISIIFNAEDMQRETLRLNAFGGAGYCYVVLPDGEVLLQSRTDEINHNNYLDFLKEECTFTNSDIDEIVKRWDSEKPEDRRGIGMFKRNSDGEEFYITYMSVEFSDWMLLGVVPSAVVNSKMSTFRTVTIGVMALIFASIIVAVTWLLVAANKQRVINKERTVKSRESLLDLLTQNTNDLFVMFSSTDFKAEYVSNNLNSVLGLDPEEIKGDVRKILNASVDKHSAFTAEGLHALDDGKVWETDTKLKNAATGEQYWYRLTLKHSEYPAKDGYVLIFSDRTQDRKMSADLETALNVAKSANQAKSNFLSNMSHDIRTPMNAILGFATLLAKDAENPDKVRDYIRKITFSGQHLLSLINDILDMSKIESGKTSLNVEEFSFSEFIDEIGSIMSPQANAKQQNFEIHASGVLPECVYGDKLRLNQIILNLLSNAIKYTPQGGNVTFTVQAGENGIHNHARLKFIVRDDGVGMSKEFLDVLFEPFSRERSSATKEIQGTGLGMTITKNLVDLMGGTMSVESEKGKGSTFTVELELAVAERRDDGGNEFWAENSICKLLVVDDEEHVCADVKELMTETGVEVDYALSGADAVAAVAAARESGKPFDLVLLDWKMPEMDGVETAKRIRAIVGKAMPIMVLTSYSFDEIEEEAKTAGIDLFLPKPFFVSNFRRAVRQLRENRPEKDANAGENLSIKGLRVLAAEDNEINAEILQELLDIEGVECDLAVNGKEALEKFESSSRGRYDMIFMDIQMPVMNGYEAARAIRACKHPDAKKIPILAMTANAFDDDVKAAWDSGMNAHLAKPINMAQLKEKVINLRNGGK